MFNFFKKSDNKHNNLDAFMQGREVRTNNESYNTNPYLPGTNEHEWWDGGWHVVDCRVNKEKGEVK